MKMDRYPPTDVSESKINSVLLLVPCLRPGAVGYPLQMAPQVDVGLKH